MVKPKKNIVIGVTLPHNAQSDAETLAICASFKQWLSIVMMPLLILMIPPFFIESMGASMTWLMTWCLLVIAGSTAVFARHRHRLILLKREKNWYSAATGRALVDIKAAALPQNKIKGIWFLPPVIVSMIPFVYSFFSSSGFDMVLNSGVFAGLTLTFWLFYHVIFRLRSEVVNENLSLTAALTRVRRYNWGKFWLIATWINGALALCTWLLADNVTAYLFFIIGYTVIFILLALHTELNARIAQQKLTSSDTGNLYLDEDDYWFWGMFYHNPNDSHLMVNDRIGMSMSVNLARPAGKVIMGFAALCIVALPFFGIWLWSEELTPTRLILSETTLIARHTGNRYTIQVGEIESIELIEELPSMVRVAGTGLDNLLKGNFRAGPLGPSRVNLQPGDPPFLVIQSGGNTYLLNDADSSVTRDVYSRIRR
ncbi:MAG: hypothetical protein FWG77_02180 [Treponema sp.]|nr:hypothetical protein [Treponema sp.]